MDIEKILEELRMNMVFLYPGFITLLIYRFSIARNVDDNKNTIVKSIIISYLYVLFLSFCIKCFKGKPFNIHDCEIGHHMMLLFMAVLIPLIWNKITRTKGFQNVLSGVGLNVQIYDNQLDILAKKEKEVWVKVYMDKLQILYEGSLRNYESDPDREQAIILSGYRMYTLNEDLSVKSLIDDMAESDDRWIRIRYNDITRLIFEYKEKH